MNLLDFGKLRSKDLLRVIKPSGLVAAEEVDAIHTQRVNTETLGDAVFSLDLVGIQSFPSLCRGHLLDAGFHCSDL
jgi:hypothetical protein